MIVVMMILGVNEGKLGCGDCVDGSDNGIDRAMVDSELIDSEAVFAMSIVAMLIC